MNTFARNGCIAESLEILDSMQRETALSPDRRTYCILLTACNHCGDTERAHSIWNGIEDDDIRCGVEVMAAFMDCLSRKGFLNEALCFLLEHDHKNGEMEVLWVSLLSGCRKHKDKQMADSVYAEMLNRFDHKSEFMASASILFSNVYGALCDDDPVQFQYDDIETVPGSKTKITPNHRIGPCVRGKLLCFTLSVCL